MLKIGLTGGIGSGKTTVAAVFKELGIPVFESDTIAKQLYFEPSIKEQIIKVIGQEAYLSDSELNKDYLKRIFHDIDLLQKVQQIIHPATRQSYSNWHAEQKAPYTINEAAIIFETGGQAQFDATIMVSAPKLVRIERVKKRDSVTEEEVKARMQNQWPEKRKMKLADFVIINDGKKDLQNQVSTIHNALQVRVLKRFN